MMGNKRSGHDAAMEKYVERMGAALLGAVMPSKHGGVTRKEGAALAYGLSMGLGFGYMIGAGDVDPTKITPNPTELAVNTLCKTLTDWPKERERYLSILDNSKPGNVYVCEVQR